MRRRAILLTASLLIATAILAQETSFPTLEALARLDVPAYDWEEASRRLTAYSGTYTAPLNRPRHAIGDRESFMLPTNDYWDKAAIATELRGMTENVLIWVQESADYSRYRAQTTAERIEREVIAPLGQLFDYGLPPGVDGDARLIVVLMRQPEFTRTAIFDKRDLIPKTLSPDSNQREIALMNLAVGGEQGLDDDFIVSTIAHEYQHILLHHRDANEDRWLDEALSSFVQYYIGDSYTVEWLGEGFLPAPETGLTHMLLGDNRHAKYGAGGLFLTFVAERYGEEVVARIHADSSDGWRSVDSALRDAAGVSADDVFADWAVANYFQDADAGFGYPKAERLLSRPEPAISLREFPTSLSGSLPQYSTDYVAVNVRGASALKLNLSQAPEARLIGVEPYEGDFFYYAAVKDGGSSRLTTKIDLRAVREAAMEYRVWYDLAEHYEYGYVEVSHDGGRTWRILPGKYTRRQNRWGLFFPDGYTGGSAGRWLQERIDLSQYVGLEILLRFEVLTDTVTTYKGMAIDDLRIEAIDFHDGFEARDEAWIEEGWIRTDNRLPQRTWLQVVQENDEGLHLSRHMMTSSGEVEIDVLPGVRQALVAISPIVPQTSLETEYAIEVSLLDADGAPMTAARECTVTTTDALNFRATPSGDKIGLVPMGMALDALDKDGDWFMVYYDGAQGWIHGDYVRTAGNCP